MIHSLAAAFDVDLIQLKALLRTALRLDLRVGQNTTDGGARRRGGGRLIRLLLAYVLTGVWVAVFIAPAETAFGAALVHLTALALIVGATVILEFNSIVLSTDDLAILGHQPVGSATFFYARLGHALIYTEALGLAFSVVPLLTLGFVSRLLGFGATLVFLATIASVVLWVTLVAVAGYVTLLRFVPAERMRTILTGSQLLISLGIYSALLVVRQRPRFDTLEGAQLAQVPELLLLPSSWFAAWIECVATGPTLEGSLAMLLSIVVLAGWIVFTGRVLAPGYLDHLSKLGSARGAGKAARKPGRFPFRRHEARAVALLVPSQFRHDYRFRLGVLGIIPLTLLYLVVAFEEGPLPNPFVTPVPSQGTILLYLAVLVSPSLLVPSFVYSDAYAASWLYYVTPADRRALVHHMRNFLVLGFLVPYMGFVAGVFFYSYGAFVDALVHAVLLGLCANLFLLGGLVLNPGLPFAAPVQRGRFSLRTFVPFVMAPFVALGVLPFVVQLGTQTPLATLQWVVLLSLCNWLGTRIVTRRIAERHARPVYLL